MKFFFQRKIPAVHDVLLFESGSPEVARRALEQIRRIFPAARYHLCTCWPDPPVGSVASVFRVVEYPSSWNKLRLLWSFRQRRWEILAILCTGEPILLWWKLAALLLLPAKALIVNENADFFWLDWGNWRIVRRFVAIRWGVNQEELLQTLVRALVFPVTLSYLLATAGWLYFRRWRKLLAWKMAGVGAAKLSRSQETTFVRDASRSKIR